MPARRFEGRLIGHVDLDPDVDIALAEHVRLFPSSIVELVDLTSGHPIRRGVRPQTVHNCLGAYRDGGLAGLETSALGRAYERQTVTIDVV